MSAEPKRQCNKCSNHLSAECFYANPGSKDGLTKRCKSCIRAAIKTYQLKNRERLRLKQRERYYLHREELAAANRKFRMENRERLTDRRRALYRKNREKKLAENKRYFESKPEARRSILKRYYERHPERFKARRAVMIAVRSGKLVRPVECSRCDSEKSIQAHHEDYSKPLDVIWVCQKCHTDIHEQKKLAGKETFK